MTTFIPAGKGWLSMLTTPRSGACTEKGGQWEHASVQDEGAVQHASKCTEPTIMTTFRLPARGGSPCEQLCGACTEKRGQWEHASVQDEGAVQHASKCTEPTIMTTFRLPARGGSPCEQLCGACIEKRGQREHASVQEDEGAVQHARRSLFSIVHHH
jgi:hypothetical protein